MDRQFFALAAVSGLALVAATCVVGLLLSPADPPTSLRAAPPVRAVPAAAVLFDDRRVVSISLVRTPESSVSVPAAGRLTWTGCTPGAEMRSGDLIAKVDEKPVLGLASGVPFYRDLGPGAQGSDVTALQAELARLGYRTPRDGRFGAATGHAVDQAFRGRGVVNPAPGRLATTSVAWLERSVGSVSACKLPIGGTAGPDVPFVTIAGRLQRVSLTAVPSGLTPGDRTVTAFGVTGRMVDRRGSDDPTFLDEVAKTPEGSFLTQVSPEAKDQPPLTGVIQLADPVRALRVPVAAVFGVQGSSACLRIASATVPVTVIGSSLGATIVRLPDGVPPPAEVNLASADSTASCVR